MTSCDVEPFSADVVGHERLAGRGRPALDDRMARVDDGQLVAVVDVRLDVVVDRGGLGQRRQHVERGERARRRLNPRRLGGHRRAQRLEDLELALEDALVGAEDLLFVFLQRRRDEALAAGDRLLAVVVGRHGAQVRLRDLDVVAEHAVVADLQRRDAGARALALLHLGDDLLAGAADRAQLVELRVDAVAREPAVARQRRRIVERASLDRVADVGEIVELARRASGRAAPAARRAPCARAG